MNISKVDLNTIIQHKLAYTYNSMLTSIFELEVSVWII